MNALIKLENKKSNFIREINFLDPEENKKGYPILIYDFFNGNELPPKYARAFLHTMSSGEIYFSISGPVRKTDENDIPLTIPKQFNGKFLDRNGNETNESLAMRENNYVLDNGSIKYSNLGYINIVNNKSNGDETKFTLFKINIINDQQANKLLKNNNLSSISMEHLKSVDNPSDNKHYLFISEGADLLSDLGFEIRIKGQDKETNNEATI